MKNTICAVFFCIASAAATAGADTLPAPRDIPFKGEIKLSVDATDQVHKILRVRQTIPVQGGRKMVLMYPQWETDSHSATQELTGLAGLIVKAGGRRIDWLRDGGDPYAFHIDVPAGARELEVEFQFLSPTDGNVLMSRDMLTLPWQKVALYPAGWFIRNIAVRSTTATTIFC